MGRSIATKKLPEQKKNRLQKRLANFLKTYRVKNELLAKDLAKALDYTPGRYGELESETTPHKRFISSLEFLHTLCSLENMSLVEFIVMLEGDSDRLNSQNKLKRALYRWENQTLKIFDPINREIRESFIKNSQNLDQETVEKSLQLFEYATKMDPDLLNKFLSVFQEITDRDS